MAARENLVFQSLASVSHFWAEVKRLSLLYQRSSKTRLTTLAPIFYTQMIKSFKVELKVNNKQRSQFIQHAGCARFAYNWALTKKKSAIDNKEKIPTYIDLNREFNALKKTTYPWMYNFSKCAPEEAIRNCEEAFHHFFLRCKNTKIKNKGFPKFKSKKKSKLSFRLKGAIKVEEDRIRLPRIGWIKLKEKNYIPQNQKIYFVTISEKAGKWFVSVTMEVDDIVPVAPIRDVLGIDLGIQTLATCSNGDVFYSKVPLAKNLSLLRKRSKQFSRKKKESKNRIKAKTKLAKLSLKIANIRKNFLHEKTSKIINENQVIVIEDLSVEQWKANRRFSRKINDLGLYMFRRQLAYKAEWNKREIVVANRYFASSQFCSCCTEKNEKLPLTKRKFECRMCGYKIDRDLNASLNLERYYRDGLARIYACGDGSSGEGENLQLSLSMKQESNINLVV